MTTADFRTRAEMSESDVLAQVIAGSPDFRAFYEAERPRICSRLVWVQDWSLPVGVDFRVTHFAGDTHYIRLRRLPALSQDAPWIAHELIHVLMDEEGFPTLGTSMRFESLAAALSSMVADLVVEKRLASFGFDVSAQHIRELAESLRQLEPIHSEPTGSLTRLLWAANYAGHLLAAQPFGEPAELSRLRQLISTRFPQVAARAEELIDRVRRVGFDTPEQQSRLFSDIIDIYGLSAILALRPHII